MRKFKYTLWYLSVLIQIYRSVLYVKVCSTDVGSVGSVSEASWEAWPCPSWSWASPCTWVFRARLGFHRCRLAQRGSPNQFFERPLTWASQSFLPSQRVYQVGVSTKQQVRVSTNQQVRVKCGTHWFSHLLVVESTTLGNGSEPKSRRLNGWACKQLD